MSKIKTRKIISFTASELRILLHCCIHRQGDLSASVTTYQLKEAEKIGKLIDKINK